MHLNKIETPWNIILCFACHVRPHVSFLSIQTCFYSHQIRYFYTLNHPVWGERQMGHSEGPGGGREHGQVHREFDDRCVPRRTGSSGRVAPSNNQGLHMVLSDEPHIPFLGRDRSAGQPQVLPLRDGDARRAMGQGAIGPCWEPHVHYPSAFSTRLLLFPAGRLPHPSRYKRLQVLGIHVVDE